MTTNTKTPPSTKISMEEALEWDAAKWWIGLDDRTVALAQLRQSLLCMPFDLFHKAVEGAAGVPVWTHEFAEPERLIRMIEDESGRTEDPVSSLIRIKAKVE